MIYRRGKRYWVQYWKDGQRFRESVPKATGENTLKAARDLERKRLGELEAGTWVGPDERRLRLTDLRALLDADYEDKERKVADRVARAWTHLTGSSPATRGHSTSPRTGCTTTSRIGAPKVPHRPPSATS